MKKDSKKPGLKAGKNGVVADNHVKKAGTTKEMVRRTTATPEKAPGGRSIG